MFGIHPAATRTDRIITLSKSRAKTAFGDESRWEEMLTGLPFGRPAEPEEIANLAVMMASPKVAYLSGTVVDVDGASVETLGPYFEAHMMFPERANIGFMQVLDPACFKLRVFERGVGETRACGSGACAAMVAGVRLGLLDPQATAILRGGELKLEWQGGANPVMMTGETAMVYLGEIEYD